MASSQANTDGYLRASNDNIKRKSNNRKGIYDWKKNGEDKGMHESKTPFNNTNRSGYPPFKKTTSLNEARNKLKSDKTKNDRGKKNDNFNNAKESMGNGKQKVPKLLQSKPSLANQVRGLKEEDLFTPPSHRKQKDSKIEQDTLEIPVNWEVSRIEQNSELEKSFKKEMRGILPFEEKKHFGYEVEKRLHTYENNEYDQGKCLKSHQGPKKISASPASDDKMTLSMLTSNRDTSKHDLSRMMITVDQFIYVISGYKNTTLSSVERLNMNKGIWQPMSDINIARTKFGSVSVRGQKIYLLGGKLVDGTRTDTIEEYDVRNDEWIESKLRIPSARSGFSNVLLSENQLIIIGGNDGQVLENVNLLNLATGEWSELPSMMTKRDELAVTIGPDGKIYAIGGYGGQNST